MKIFLILFLFRIVSTSFGQDDDTTEVYPMITICVDHTGQIVPCPTNTMPESYRWSIPTDANYSEPTAAGTTDGSGTMSQSIDTNDICRVIISGTNSAMNILSIGGDTNTIAQGLYNSANNSMAYYVDNQTQLVVGATDDGSWYSIGGDGAMSEYQWATQGTVGAYTASFKIPLSMITTDLVWSAGSPYFPGGVGGSTFDFTKLGNGQSYNSQIGQRVFPTTGGMGFNDNTVKGWSGLCTFASKLCLMVVTVGCASAIWFIGMWMVETQGLTKMSSTKSTNQELWGFNANFLLSKYNVMTMTSLDVSIHGGTIFAMLAVLGFGFNVSGTQITLISRLLGPGGADIGSAGDAVGSGMVPAFEKFLFQFFPVPQIEQIIACACVSAIFVFGSAVVGYRLQQAAQA